MAKDTESISSETVGSILQAIADLLATATSETEYNIIRFWKETLQQYCSVYEIMAYAARVIEICPMVKLLRLVLFI